MSYQKKSLILQELEQAIRKKAQQKSRNKDQVNRAIQGSIQKKKNVLKTTTNMNKEARITSIHKNSQTASKPNLAQKAVSIFNNEHLTAFETSQFKAKKYNNRRLDKLVSLIQYVISSSEKALRYISSNNFEAEFALKLYRSDRENLVNQLKNLNFDDIIDSQRYNEKGDNPKQDQNFNILLQQNNKLKKQILILQKQASTYHNKIKQGESFELRHLQKENLKLKETLRKLIPFQGFRQIIQLLQKQNKFEIMLTKCQQNSKKTTQIQIVISSIENERAFIVQSLSKMKEGKSQRSFKLSQIQGQKEQLQKQLQQMKAKLSQIIDSGKSLNELQLIKKNSELVNEKLFTIVKDLSSNAVLKKSSQHLLDNIKSICYSLKSKNSQLSLTVTSLSQENESLKKQMCELAREKQQLENELKGEDELMNMQDMLSQIEHLKNIVDDFSQSQQASANKIEELEEQLALREERVQKIIFELQREKDASSKMKMLVDEANNELQLTTVKHQEKQQFYRDKLMKLQQGNRILSQQIQQTQKQNQDLRESLDEALRRNESRQDSKLLFTQKIKLDYQSRYQIMEKQQQAIEKQLESKCIQIKQLQLANNNLVTQNRRLQQKIGEQQQRIQELEGKIAKANKSEAHYKKEMNILVQSQAQLKTRMNQFDTLISDIRQQKEELVTKLKIAQGKISQKEEVNASLYQQQKQTLLKQIKAANSQIAIMAEQALQMQEKFFEKQDIIVQLQQRLVKQAAQMKQVRTKYLQLTLQQKNAKQQLQFLKNQKQSAERLMQQNRLKHHQQILELNKQIQEYQLKTIKIQNENTSIRQQLQVQRQKVVLLDERINRIAQEMNELQEENRELKLISNSALSEKEHSRELINSIEGERNSLKFQLNNTKQKFEDQSQIVRFKNKQYVNLLRQILKGLDLDPAEYADKSSFQELLEFGSQQVVQLRKRLRQQESNKRKNEKREFDVVHEFDQPSLEQCKVQLFSNNQQSQNKRSFFNQEITNRNDHEQKILEGSYRKQNEQRLDIDDFGELKNELNNSMTSQQENILRQNLQQFNDLESQKANESMMSNDLNQLQMQVNNQLGNNLSQFNEAQQSQLSQNHSQYSQQLENHRQSQQQSSEVDEYNISNKLPQNSSIENQMDNNSMIFNMDAIHPKKEQSVQKVKRPYSKYTDRSIALKNQQLDLDQFQEVKSVEDNHSVVSNNDFGQNNSGLMKQDKDLIDPLDVKLYPLKIEAGQQQKEINLEQFKQLDGEGLSQSMLSQQQAVNIDEFGDLAQSGLGQSMLSNRQQQRLSINSSHGKGKDAQNLGIDQFGEVEEQMNNSMLSNKNSQHGLSEFGELGQQKLNDSVLSKQEKQHGMSQFGEIQENQMNDSILSANLNQIIQQRKPEQGQNFDEFDEYKSQKMSESMISENEGLSPRRQLQ